MFRVTEERRDRQRSQTRLVVGARMTREAPRSGVERQQSVKRPDPQRAVVLVEQGIATVVDRDRGVDRIVAGPERGPSIRVSPRRGCRSRGSRARREDTLDVVRQQGAVRRVELRETARPAVVAVHAVVVGPHPEAFGRRVLDDAAHRIVAQRIAGRIVAQDPETPRQRMIVAHPAVVGAEPDAPLVVDEDRTDGVVAQGSGTRRIDILFEAFRPGIEDRQAVEGPDPQPAFGVAAQHADVVRHQSGYSAAV